MKETTRPGGGWGRVLVVDDDADVQNLIAIALGGAPGYTVEVCGSSREALPRARTFAPDVILLDVMMPGIDGPGTLTALRADEATAHIPIVFISAGIDHNDGREYRALGAAGVIAKPFDVARLPDTLERIRGGQPAGEQYPPPDFQRLRGAYLAELPERLTAMEDAAAAIVGAGWNRPTVEQLLALAHRTRGSAGLFGLDAVARASGVLEDLLQRALADSRWPPSRSPVELVTVVRAIAAAAARPRKRSRGQ
jgi:two-component system OmpR family response regulator